MIVTLVRTVVFYIALVVALRLMGKRQIGEMQPGELVITILITECAAAPLQDLSRPVSNGIIAIFTLVILEIILSVLTIKMPFLRKALEGNPVIIVRNGKIDQNAMRKTRLSVEDLLTALRQNDVFDMHDVLYAIMETDGKISILKTPEVRPATAQMMGKVPPSNGLPWLVIADGKIHKKAMDICNITEEKIKSVLKKEKTPLEDVFIMTADCSGNYDLIKKERKK